MDMDFNDLFRMLDSEISLPGNPLSSDADTLEHLTPREKAHLRNYRDLDDNNKERVEGLTASLLSAQQEAADYLIAAHARTDIETSEEMVNADLELLKKKARW